MDPASIMASCIDFVLATQCCCAIYSARPHTEPASPTAAMPGSDDVDFEGLELIPVRLEIDTEKLIQVRPSEQAGRTRLRL